jgi:putative transposase
MAKKRFKAEEIIQHLRTAEIDEQKGISFEETARKIGVCGATLARWKKEFGGLRVDQAKRLKELEQENARLKKLVANQALDIDILKVAASGNF